MRYVGGVDIGGTKCAVSIGCVDGDTVKTVEKIKIATPKEPKQALERMTALLQELANKHPECPLAAIGISCGSPLDSEKGLILAPPNLPNWNSVDVVTPFAECFHVPAAVQNDANACALAEWLWGAGRGTGNMIFLTFGTGMGAGLILNSKLYAGADDMAGEVGHIRLEETGPVGYHKKGSFEGFCSGGGIARLGRQMLTQHIQDGHKSAILKAGRAIDEVTAEDIGIAAEEGDALALEIFRLVGEKLGMGLAVLIDILNPEKIVIGSIFLRQEQILRPAMEKMIRKEALAISEESCGIVPAGLGEELGDFAAYSVAINKLMNCDNRLWKG